MKDEQKKFIGPLETAPLWQGRLRDAFQRHAAFGLFIDYQGSFLDIHTYSAFHNGANLSQGLRNAGIKNYWAAQTSAYSGSAVPYHAMKLPRCDQFIIALPSADEIIFTKQTQSVLKNARALEFMRNQNNPVIIAGGVYADKCFHSSITAIAHEIECDIIIPYDACNFTSVDQVQRLGIVSGWDQCIPPKGRYHATTTKDVVDFLPQLEN